MSTKLGKTARILGVTVAASALLFGGVNASATPAPDAPSTSNNSIRADEVEMVVTEQNVEEAMKISQEKPVIFKVGAEWCGPCQELKPVISGYAHDDAGKWMLGDIDGDKSPGLVDRFGVDGYPTMVAYSKGKEVDRMVGYSGDKQEVRQWVDSVLQAGGAQR